MKPYEVAQKWWKLRDKNTNSGHEVSYKLLLEYGNRFTLKELLNLSEYFKWEFEEKDCENFFLKYYKIRLKVQIFELWE